MTVALTQSEVLRYSRHFPVIGLEGQKKLKQAKLLCIGAGGLGCPSLQYLVAAGVGTIGIVDGDNIDITNLQRQILFSEQDLGKNKAQVAKQKLNELNSSVNINSYPHYLDEEQATQLIEQYDIVLDATDNYPARYLINSICRSLGKPLVSASIFQFDAQISVFNYQSGPCYQCLYPEPPPPELTPNCATGGVLGVLPGVAGTLQATEAIKVILAEGETLSGQLLSIDLLSLRFSLFEITKQNCQHHPVIDFSNITTSCSVVNLETEDISVSDLARQLEINADNLQLIDVREAYERDICHIGGLHIPLSQLPDRLTNIDKNKSTVIYCRSGVRSSKACQLLRQAGFENVKNLTGGILAWIDSVDDSLIRY